MDYGLYLAASGALQSMQRQDVMANNLANVTTIGFKPDLVTAQARLPERLENPGEHADADPRTMLERLGGGVRTAATRIDDRQGPLERSGGTLDFAIDGKGWFAVGGAGADELRLTRDGRFTRNASGRLVTAGTGLDVLDAKGRPITLDASGAVTVDVSGAIRQDGAVVAQLMVLEPPAERLVKTGDNLARVEGTWKRTPGTGSVRQGWLESSAVDPVLALNDMVNASKAGQASLKMMQYHDHILGQVINTFGRVA